MNREPRPGAILMTYGSPDSLDRHDVARYLARVRGGRDADDGLVDEFTRRYRVIGGSPLIGITRDQADALSRNLGWPVEIGMRFSEPSIEAGLRELSRVGVTDVAGIILSPQYSPMLMGGYARAVDAARTSMGSGAPRVSMAGSWWEEGAFIGSVAGRVRDALSSSPGQRPGRVHVLMTAHSLPKRVAVQEPDYLRQLRATADAVASASGLKAEQWSFCWQSAGHEPGEWMTPDFADLMPEIAASGGSRVVVVPIQFLADHLETLYDVDVGAREQAASAGLEFERIPSLNADRGLVEALAVVARTSLSQSGVAA